jgi:hypothetical protein
MLFDRLRADKSADESVLILGGADGLGSIAHSAGKATDQPQNHCHSIKIGNSCYCPAAVQEPGVAEGIALKKA